MKIKCPECKKDAQLESNCSCIKCEQCEMEWEFGEYVKLAAKDDPATSDLLADYDENTEDESKDLVEWG